MKIIRDTIAFFQKLMPVWTIEFEAFGKVHRTIFSTTSYRKAKKEMFDSRMFFTNAKIVRLR